MRGDLLIGTVYWMRRDSDGTFTIGVSTLTVDENSNVTVRGVMNEDTDAL